MGSNRNVLRENCPRVSIRALEREESLGWSSNEYQYFFKGIKRESEKERQTRGIGSKQEHYFAMEEL